MTFKMLIVDDEPIIRRGLASTIPWKENNIEVIDTAHDGEDAINKVKKNNGIDLIITDVKMPNKDGLQLAKFLSENYPQTKIIMISGYDDFKYAQKAIQLGVKDYLLKPVDIDELLQVVRKITQEFNKEQMESYQLQQISLRNAIYHQVFDYPLEVTEELASKANVTIYPFLSMLKNYAKVTDNMLLEELKEYKFQWKKSVENRLSEEGFTSVSIFISENILLTCIMDDSISLFTRDLLLIAEESAFHQLLVVLNDTSVQLKDLSKTNKILSRKINDLPINSEGIIFYSDKETPKQTIHPYPEKIEDNLISSIVQFNQSKIDEHTNQLFNYLESNQFLLEETVLVCRKVIKKVVERFKNLSQKDSVEIPLLFDRDLDVLLFDSYEFMQEMFEKDLEKVIFEFDLKEVDNKDWLMERALDYIHSYYKSDIKIQEVAGVINISPNYFSTLFKQKTGKNFNEYVNHMRVEEAKTLLAETPFKVSEISEQVGFHEYKYFVEVFKKFSGVTPTKYRKFKSIK